MMWPLRREMNFVFSQSNSPAWRMLPRRQVNNRSNSAALIQANCHGDRVIRFSKLHHETDRSFVRLLHWSCLVIAGFILDVATAPVDGSSPTDSKQTFCQRDFPAKLNGSR